jgi:hypothetical protein
MFWILFSWDFDFRVWLNYIVISSVLIGCHGLVILKKLSVSGVKAWREADDYTENNWFPEKTSSDEQDPLLVCSDPPPGEISRVDSELCIDFIILDELDSTQRADSKI